MLEKMEETTSLMEGVVLSTYHARQLQLQKCQGVYFYTFQTLIGQWSFHRPHVLYVELRDDKCMQLKINLQLSWSSINRWSRLLSTSGKNSQLNVSIYCFFFFLNNFDDVGWKCCHGPTINQEYNLEINR